MFDKSNLIAETFGARFFSVLELVLLHKFQKFCHTLLPFSIFFIHRKGRAVAATIAEALEDRRYFKPFRLATAVVPPPQLSAKVRVPALAPVIFR